MQCEVVKGEGFKNEGLTWEFGRKVEIWAKKEGGFKEGAGSKAAMLVERSFVFGVPEALTGGCIGSGRRPTTTKGGDGSPAKFQKIPAMLAMLAAHAGGGFP